MTRLVSGFSFALILSLAATLPAGCAALDGEEYLEVSCSGKCDGLDSLRNLWRDPSDINLDDLVHIATPYATDALNDALSFSDYGSIRITEPTMYGSPEDANGTSVRNINSLASGLVARFGERELTTEVNKARAAHLRASNDKVFADCAFRINANLNHNWNFNTGFQDADGDDVTVTLGFRPGVSLEARTVAAFKSNLTGVLNSPLRSLREMRGFVFPRSFDEVRDLHPGESYALRGRGTLGVNLGVGVPILIADPTSWLTYKIVLSAAMGARIEGEIDIQLVRLGDEVVVDVGIEKGRAQYARVGLRDSWGVQGLLEREVNIAGYDVDVGKLVEKALQDRLNDYLTFSARAETSSKKSRMSVARLRFSLEEGDQDLVSKALAQALRADVRLAQSLANRGEKGVVADFDLLRSGASSASYAGIDIFGMSFFREVESGTGSVVVQTPGGVRSLLFDSLHREGGWFWASHAYTRVSLSGLIFDLRRAPEGEANLFVQVEEGDEYMKIDTAKDHLDGLIFSLAGRNALRAFEGPANELVRLAWKTCAPLTGEPFPGDRDFLGDDCNVDFLEEPIVEQLGNRAMNALEPHLGQLDTKVKELVRQVARLRLAASAVVDQPDLNGGPTASFVIDYRLDDGALEYVMTRRNAGDLTDAVLSYLDAVVVDRLDRPTTITAHRNFLRGLLADELSSMARKFERHAGDYQRLLSVEKATIETLGEIGGRAIEIRYPVKAGNAPDYEQATARSISQSRSKVATAMFDDLRKAGKKINRVHDPELPGWTVSHHPEQTAAYALLSLLPAQRTDLRVDIKTDNDSGFTIRRERYEDAGFDGFDRHVRGSDVELIDGGQFSIDALIDLP